MISTTAILFAFGLFASQTQAAPRARQTTSSAASASAPGPASATGTITASAAATATGSFVNPSPNSATIVSIDIDDQNFESWTPDTNLPDSELQPIHNGTGAPILGPENIPVQKENADLLIPPSTDHGSVNNAKWPFALSHNRIQTGGWARQQNVGVMPIATEMAAVNMRLTPGAVRELHWHKTAEWAYVLAGNVQVTSVDSQGKNFIGTVGPGDLWYFPAGTPHSLQATDDNPNGAEFILVFDSGSFSEDSTFLLSDWLAHTPLEVIEKNFAFAADDKSAEKFAHIPEEELYIFPAPLPGPDSDGVKSPQGAVDNPFTFKLSQFNETKLSGGSVKIVDSSIFKISTTIAVAEVTVEPGAIREMHWHPTQDEWSFFLEGEARNTIFAAQSNARTFTYQAGDIGYVPATMGHYVENTGNTTLKFLEIFNTDHFEDISLSNWLALTPPELVKSHLGFDDETIGHLQKTKPVVVGPA